MVSTNDSIFPKDINFMGTIREGKNRQIDKKTNNVGCLSIALNISPVENLNEKRTRPRWRPLM